MARNKPSSLKEICCAIYTRKSHEEGLEQDFNSLDAQREACEAYITSQKHEGWQVLPDFYDDGGISGATMERPALQRLLRDVSSGAVDVVVVYKVDRLTRSLPDFAKIVDTFDEQDVSFVSVTQQFNTTSSMGRLTLNVLLSFAQFEREVTAERIRDKIAASKKKGMWMGGNLPLGYDSQDRKLVINEVEAETVRFIFKRYLELGSVRLLKQDLKAAGVVSKIRISEAGRQHGGKPFERGALYHLLQNRIYLGEITHKDESYPGEHEAIIDPEPWDQVQQLLTQGRVERQTGHHAKEASLLTGLLFDEKGQRMSPSHANKKGRRYRYYVSQSLVAGKSRRDPSGRRMPAAEIEGLVSDRICAFLQDQNVVLSLVSSQKLSVIEQQDLLSRLCEAAMRWQTLLPSEKRALLLSLVDRIEIRATEVSIQVRISAVMNMDLDEGNEVIGDDLHEIIVSARLRRCGVETKLVVDGAGGQQQQKPNKSLVRLLVQAHRYQDRMLKNDGQSIGELAEAEKVSPSYFIRILRLSYLAPDIIQAIITGCQPPELTARQLKLVSPLPMLWEEQRTILGFA